MIASRTARGLPAAVMAWAIAPVLVTVLVTGCAVKLQAPAEPIRFDVNVNITEQKRLEIDQELLALIRRNPELFGLTASDLAESSN